MTAARSRGTGKLVLSIVVALVGTFLTVLLVFPLHYLGWDNDLGIELECALVMMLGVAVLGGVRMLRPSAGSFAEAWHVAAPILVVSLVLCALQLYSYVATGATLSSSWAVDCVYYLVLCLGIGLYEECYVRGVLLHGLLARFGWTRRGMGVSVLLAALYFGYLHISWPELDYGNGLEVAQAALKVAQTAIYGVVLSAAIIKSGNLTGAALFHALDDYAVMVVPYALFGEQMSTDYVSSSTAEAWESIILYGILVVLYLPSLVRAIGELRRLQPPQRGGFVRTPDQPLPPQAKHMAYGTTAQGAAAVDRARKGLPPDPRLPAVPTPVPTREGLPPDPRVPAVPTPVRAAGDPAGADGRRTGDSGYGGEGPVPR